MPTSSSPRTHLATPIIGIGASAGGLDACRTFLENVSADCGFGIVIVTHLDPGHPSILAELLDKSSSLPVEQAADGKQAKANQVYVVPPNSNVRIEGGVLHLSPFTSGDRLNPIDRFFQSLAADLEHRSVGIILSGTGSDGTVGLGAIKEVGGLTLVQDPDSAAFDGMPRCALSRVPVDKSLLAEHMPRLLDDYIRQLDEPQELDSGLEDQDIDNCLVQVCQVLKKTVGHDFSQYKTNTLLRRIQRRMLMLKLTSFSAYLSRLGGDPAECQRLLKELLITVTRFFRDADAFVVLSEVLREAIEQKGSEPLRIWIPACATGEEAYSVAMLVSEEFERLGKPISAQIFATDIDEESLDKARRGHFPPSIAGDVSAERLRRFFLLRSDRYEVSKALRTLCLFSRHNLISDPPFSRIDLVSCRNLLIYFGPQLQARAVSTFHYSLVTGGKLFLGSAETLGQHGRMFRALDKSHRIYVALESERTGRRFPFMLSTQAGMLAPERLPKGRESFEIGPVLARLVLPKLDVTVIAIDGHDRVLDSCGHPQRFLDVRPGPLDANLFSLLKKELTAPLRGALHQARREKAGVTLPALSLPELGESKRLSIQLLPFEGEPDSGVMMLVFEETDSSEASRDEMSMEFSSESLVVQLEAELHAARTHLHATTEELEAHIEELRSTNEEMLSMNEELQTSNEELETSKEEIQSANQELQSVNGELNQSIEDRFRAHSDLLNLFSNNPNPTVFLDRNLCIRQFTPASAEVFRLLPSDTGRPITDIASRVGDMALSEHCQNVLRSLVPYEATLLRSERNGPGRIYQLRITVYRTLDEVIDGVVLSFFDISELEKVKRVAERRAHELSAIAELGALSPPNSNEPDTLMQEALSEVCRLLSVEVASFHRVLPESGELEIVSAQNWTGPTRTPLSRNSAWGLALSSGRTVSSSSLSDDERFAPSPILAEQELNSAIISPVWAAGQLAGLLGAYSSGHRDFASGKKSFLESVAYLLGTFLARSEMDFLHSLERCVADCLASPLPPLQAVQAMLDDFDRELGSLGCELWLPAPTDPETLVCATAHSRPDSAGLSTSLALAQQVWKQNSSICVSDSASLSASGSDSKGVASAATSGAFAFPVSSGDRPSAVITCRFARRIFTSERLLVALTGAGLGLGELFRRTQAEAALKESEQNLYKGLKAVPFPLCVIDELGEILLVSDAAYRISGFSTEANVTTGSWASQALRDPALEAHLLAELRDMAGKQEVRDHGVVSVFSAGGAELRWHVITSPLSQSGDGRYTFVSVAYDVTDQEHTFRG